jgi:hypothetical protein
MLKRSAKELQRCASQQRVLHEDGLFAHLAGNEEQETECCSAYR